MNQIMVQKHVAITGNKPEEDRCIIKTNALSLTNTCVANHSVIFAWYHLIMSE